MYSTSWEDGGLDGWFSQGAGLSTLTNRSQGPYPASYNGSHVLEMSASMGGAWNARDFTPGGTLAVGKRYTVGVWVRTPPGGGALTGGLYIWTTGAIPELWHTYFISSSSWQYVTTTAILTQPGNSTLRVELCMNTTGVNVDLDSLNVWGPY